MAAKKGRKSSAKKPDETSGAKRGGKRRPKAPTELPTETLEIRRGSGPDIHEQQAVGAQRRAEHESGHRPRDGGMPNTSAAADAARAQSGFATPPITPELPGTPPSEPEE